MAGVSTNVLVLGIVSLLTDMSSEMIYPILPLFLTGIGATGLIIGLIEGAAETTASLVKVLSGWYSDKFNKRKRFIFAGYGLSSATKPLLAFVTNYWQVLGIRVDRTRRQGHPERSQGCIDRRLHQCRRKGARPSVSIRRWIPPVR